MQIKPRRIKKVVIINPRRIGAYSQFSFKDPMPSEGVIIVATIIKEMGYDSVVIDESTTPLYSTSSLLQTIAEADIVGVGGMTCTEDRGYYLLREAKKLNPNVVCLAGGFGASSNPTKALKQGTDIVVVGEGVETIRELMQIFSDGGDLDKVAGITYQQDDAIIKNAQRPLIKNLDNVPFADWRLVIDYQKIQSRTFTLSAGCPFRCKFCSAWQFSGGSYRHRSVENAVEYTKWASLGHRPVKWTGKKTLFIGDDNIAGNKNWTKQYLEELNKLDLSDISISAEMRAEYCRDEELMSLLAPNIGWIFFGYEDITESGLLSINKKQTPDDIVFSVETCHQYGINIAGMFILGLDPHTKESGINIAKFALKHNIDVLILFIRCPFPGTEDTKDLSEAGRLISGIPTSYRDCQYVVFEPLNMTAQELQMSHLKAIRTFYNVPQAMRDRLNRRIGNEQLIYRLAGSYYAGKLKNIAGGFASKYLK